MACATYYYEAMKVSSALLKCKVGSLARQIYILQVLIFVFNSNKKIKEIRIYRYME